MQQNYGLMVITWLMENYMFEYLTKIGKLQMLQLSVRKQTTKNKIK